MQMSGRPAVRLSAAVLAFVVAHGTAGAQGALTQATPAACVTAQTADPVPVRVRAPNETLELRIADTVSGASMG